MRLFLTSVAAFGTLAFLACGEGAGDTKENKDKPVADGSPDDGSPVDGSPADGTSDGAPDGGDEVSAYGVELADFVVGAVGVFHNDRVKSRLAVATGRFDVDCVSGRGHVGIKNRGLIGFLMHITFSDCVIVKDGDSRTLNGEVIVDKGAYEAFYADGLKFAGLLPSATGSSSSVQSDKTCKMALVVTNGAASGSMCDLLLGGQPAPSNFGELLTELSDSVPMGPNTFTAVEGTWSKACSFGEIESWTFDAAGAATRKRTSYDGAGCTPPVSKHEYDLYFYKVRRDSGGGIMDLDLARYQERYNPLLQPAADAYNVGPFHECDKSDWLAGDDVTCGVNPGNAIVEFGTFTVAGTDLMISNFVDDPADRDPANLGPYVKQ